MTRARLSLALSLSVSLLCGASYAAAHDDGAAPSVPATAPGGPWKAPEAYGKRGTVRVQLLGFNDFHGRLSPGLKFEGRPVGGAAVLAAYLRAEQASFAGTSFIVHAGDHVGASPPESALLQDEPALMWLDMLANPWCSRVRSHPACNVVGTLGNHEFDEGSAEMLRLLRGGDHARGPFSSGPFRGVRFPYVSANVLDARTGKTVLTPYVVRYAEGEPIVFLGATLEGAPRVITPAGARGIRFADEAESINKHVRALKKQGIQSFVVLIHQGGHQAPYEGATRADGVMPASDPEIVDVVSRLDEAVDVVVSGHAHSFTNMLLPNAGGRPTLVTQAYSTGTAFADIELVIDRERHDVVEKVATIVHTFGDAGPGLTPASDVALLVERAKQRVAPLVDRKVGEAKVAMVRERNEAGESPLGNLIADAQRAAVGADVAIMNAGGIRADLDQGPITWGELFTIQPFGNDVVKLEITGAGILALLEQQWSESATRILQVSGMRVVWDPARPLGSRIVSVRVGDAPLDPARTYTLAVNSFLAPGGDGFTTLSGGKNREVGPVDLEALTRYVESQKAPIEARIEARITRLGGK